MDKLYLNKVKSALKGIKVSFVFFVAIFILINLRLMGGVLVEFAEAEFFNIFAYSSLIYFLTWLVTYVYLLFKKKNKYRYFAYNLLLNFMIVLIINKGELWSSLTDFFSLLNFFED